MEFGPQLLKAYEQSGLSFLEGLSGWFSGILIDLAASKIVLFNDRYGLQRVYYHQDESGFYFSSEAKSLLKALPHLRQLNPSALAEYCSFGCALQNKTLFAGISLLPGGSCWTFCHGHFPQRNTYFSPKAWENQEPLDEEQFYSALKETFRRILPKYFRDQERIGMSLTGGLDGRMIMAWAERPPGSLPCYTFGGTYRDCTDVRIAREVAKTCRQPHQVIPVNDSFLKQFPRLAERAIYISDGAMDVTGSVELYVNQLAREIAPIRMTGNYGSEILRGNVAFKPGPLNPEVYEFGFASSGRAAAETYAAEKQVHPVSFIAFKQVPWHHYSRLSVEQSVLTLRAPYLDKDLVRLMYRVPAEVITRKEPSLRLIDEGNPELSRIATDRGLLYRPAPLLTKARHLYEEFTFRAEYTYDYGMPQWLARLDHALAPLRLERHFLGRHKFFHFRVWYRDGLAEHVRDVILDTRTRNRPYLNGKRLEAMVQSHLRGTRNYTTEIHKILTCELIHRQLIERNWERE